MNIEKNELWDRLENEPERAYRAFEVYRNLPSGERTLIAAYRQHVGNPDAAKPSDTWSRWSNEFAWRERAAAHDAHLDRIRERSIEKAIEEEAEKQARVVEQTRYRFTEMTTLMYEKAITNLEESEFWESMRPQDVINVVRLHLDSIVKLGEMLPQEGAVAESDWNPELDAEVDRIMGEIEAEREEEPSESDETDEEEVSEESEGEEDSEDSEDGPD